jgi:large subunit ribosomal protein L22
MSKALLKFVRVSPTKARLIAREVQGMNAELALAALEFMPNKAAGIIAKVIASAVANGDYEPEEVIITSCRVDKAAVMKRWRPRARGTATRIIKPTAHILVEVATVASIETEQASPKKETVKKETKKAEAPKAEAKKPAAKAEEKGDDLTKIKGIGKVYAGKLQAEGIASFEAVANMTQEQIDMMEEKYSFKGDFKDSIADAKNILNAKEA